MTGEEERNKLIEKRKRLDEAIKTMKSPVQWGDDYIEHEEASRRTKEAQELSKGLNLVTSEQRSWYGDSYTVHLPDYYGLAQLIERIRGEKK